MKNGSVRATVVLAALAVGIACSARTLVGIPQGTGSVELRAEAVSVPATAARIEVSAMPANAVFPLQYDAARDTFSGVLHLPSGEQLLTATAYDGEGRPLAAGTVTVAIESGKTAVVYLALYGTRPEGQPDLGPVITFLSVPKTRVLFGEQVNLTAAALDPDGDALEWHWSSNCSLSAFGSPSSPSTTWSSGEEGVCVLQLSVTSNGLTASETVAVFVSTGDGRASVNVGYSPYPLLTGFRLETTGPCAIARVDANGTCAGKAIPAQEVSGSVTFELDSVPRDPVVELVDSCGGTFESTMLVLDGESGRYDFTWRPVVQAGSVCVLKAILTHRNASDELAVAILVDDLNVADVFDLSALNIADFRNGKRAAASYTFDDGPASSFVIAELFDSHDVRATFFIIPGNIVACCGETLWARWRDVAARGHEVGNHSMNHLDLSKPDLTDEQLEVQIEGAQRLIGEEIGTAPLTFSFPQSGTTDRASAFALRSHVATRNVGLPFDGPGYRLVPISATSTIEGLEYQLLDSLAAGAWFVGTGHGMDGDGWSPISSAVLDAHLAFAAAHSRELWIDTFANVAMYRLAREQVHPNVLALSRRTFTIGLQGDTAEALARVPLTLKLPVAHWPDAIVARDSGGVERPVTRTDDAILFDMYPGEELDFQLATRSGQ